MAAAHFLLYANYKKNQVKYLLYFQWCHNTAAKSVFTGKLAKKKKNHSSSISENDWTHRKRDEIIRQT
jgi:hypothetical protein